MKMRTDYRDTEGNLMLVVNLWDSDMVDCAMCDEP
jgi:hypothetical protein